jgi:molecular chaperone DnaJ
MSAAEKRCYYEILGVSREASCDEVRKAYKQAAMRFHPDRNPNDPTAEQKFKEANEAFQVLSDDQKRNIYDQFGHAGLDGSGIDFGAGMGDMFAHMQDLFAEMFSGGFGFGGRERQRGADLRVQSRLTLEDAAFGCKREVSVQVPARCDDCGGSGAAPGTKPDACPMCRGTGQVSSARGFVMFTAPCSRCSGRGAVIKTPCKTCHAEGVVQKAKKVNVTFPPGIDSGQRLRVTGQGLPGANGPGDLYVEVDVEDDPRFERDGCDVVTRVTVPFSVAALGGEVRVPCLEKKNGDGEEPTLPVTLPPGTQPGHVIQMKAKGLPRLDGRGRGSLVVVVQVEVPKDLSVRARELIDELHTELTGGEVSRKRAAKA